VPAFNILDNKTATIGDLRLRLDQVEPPLDDKWRYILAAAGNDRHAPQLQKLETHQLRFISPADIPNGMSLSIYQPRSVFREIDFLQLQKFNDSSQLIVTVTFDFADWHLPKNLRDFIDDYCAMLKNEVDNFVNAYPDQNDVGFSIICSATVPPSENFYAAYQKLSDQILKSYRHTLATLFSKTDNTVKSITISQPTDTHGARWWIRYVAVPVLGSGAVITAILALLK
jgi:hypothetical protein